MYDVENRKYLDFTAGIAVNALGHCDPGFSRIVAEQVRYYIIQSFGLCWNAGARS